MLPERVLRFMRALERGVSLQDIGRSRPVASGLETVAALLARTHVTPNVLTLVSLVPAVLAGIAAAHGAFGWAALLMLSSGLFDLLDGPLARTTGRATRFGALLDSTVDRIADAAPLLGLSIFSAGSGWWAAIPAFALLSGYTVSYVRARCEGLNVQLPPLWMRRGDRMALVALSLLAGLISPPLALAGVGLTGVLGALAAADALRVARHIIEDKPAEPGVDRSGVRRA